MEVCEQNEAFVEEHGDLAFSHTKIILREGDQYYYAVTSHYYPTTSEVDLLELDLVPIPTAQIWPLFPRQFTRVPEPLPQDCYIKRPSLLYYGDTEASTELSSLLLNEAEACEILRAFPHPNIAQYLGCMVENDRITGLCFVKYGVNLSERVTKDSRPFDVNLCLRGIQNGIRHLHNLNLIHCDLNPTNILMNGDTPVIGDLDSCRRKGEKLGFKAGTRGWTSQDFKFARPENDEYGLSKIRDFLFQVFKQETFQRKIPLEIRKLIWQYTLPASRIIQITVREDYDGSFFSGGTPPVALHICSESRQEALSVYQPFFVFDHEMESISRPICFSTTRDILYFAERNALRDAQFIYRFPEMKEIRSIALHYDPHDHDLTESFDLRPFQNLTELILVERYFDEPVFEFRCCGSTTFFDLDYKWPPVFELMQRWEALEEHFTEALYEQCPKGTTPIVRRVRIGQMPQRPCYANLEYTRSEPPS